MEIEFDASKADTNRKKHGVSFEEAAADKAYFCPKGVKKRGQTICAKNMIFQKRNVRKMFRT